MKNNNDNSYLTLRDLWELLLENIWLFASTLTIALAVGIYVIAVTPPTYSRTAVILIKDDQQGQSSIGAAFENMGIVKSNNDLFNELHILGTPRLMEEVVARLSLNYNYRLKYKGIRWVDIYHSAPFEVEVDAQLYNSNISLELLTDGVAQYQVESLMIEDEPIDIDEPIGQFGQSISTPYGKLTITKNLSYDKASDKELYSFTKRDIESTASSISQSLSIKLRDENASIVNLALTMESRNKAEDILNMLITVYSENWVEDKNIILTSTTNFINERLEIIAEELGDVDQDIASYKSKNLLPDMGAVAGINLASSSEIVKRQIELNNQVAIAKYILKKIEDNSSSDELLPVNAGLQAATIDSQIEKYNMLQLQRRNLMANSSENNPIVAEISTNLEASKGVLKISMEDYIKTLNIQIEQAQKEEKDAAGRLSSNPEQELFLLSTGREQMIKEQLYLYLLQKREENALSQAFTAYNTKILSFAKGSNAPVAPQKWVILLFSLAIGLIAPTVFLIVRAAFDTFVTCKKDLEGMNIPLIGSIPRIGSLKKGKESKGATTNNGIIVSRDNRDSGNEAFRVLRTNLDFMISNEDHKGHVIQTISMNPGSGKSLLTSNLGLSMALKDAKVLLIDADIRKATLSEMFEAPKTGLSEYLSGKITNIKEVITPTNKGNGLDILPVGKIPPNPSELLLKPRFAEMIEQLKGEYQYIFIDCPPVEIVPDAAIIAKVCDMAMFVIRAGKFDKRLLPDVEALHQSQKYNNLCLVLNDVDYSSKGYYGYKKYGYYGYGYGYSDQKK